MEITLKYIKEFNTEKNNYNEEKLFYLLNLSLISGEFLQNYNDFKTEIGTIYNVSEIFHSIDPTDNNLERKGTLQDNIFFKDAIKYYSSLADNINDNLKKLLSHEPYDEKDVKAKKIKIKYELDKLFSERNDFNNTKSKPGYFLFLINLSLAELDEYLECNDWCLNEIEIFKNYLEEDNNLIIDKWSASIIKILKDKCEYLEFKINFRRNKKLSATMIESSAFYKFYLDTINHYYKKEVINDNSKFIESCFDELNLNIEADSKKVHQFNKYLKNSNKLKLDKKLSLIKDLLIKIELESDSQTNEFKQVSLNSSYNLLQNTQIFLILRNEEINNYKNICDENFYKKDSFENNKFIKDIRKELERPYIDYRGYEHVIDFLDKLLEKLQTPDDFFDFFDDTDIKESKLEIFKENLLKNLIAIKELYESILFKIEENKLHLSYYELKPIYLDLEDCIKTFVIKSPVDDGQEEEVIEIFLDSAYILPIDYEKISNKINQKKLVYRYEIKLIKGRLDILFDLDSAKKNYKNIENKLKENEFKVVQIVAMFVSIATFVLINVKIFDNKSGVESIAIIIGLAGVFTLFNGFFNWLIQGQLNNRNNSFNNWIFGVSSTLIILSLIIIYCYNDKTIINKMEIQLDSKIDSIIQTKTEEWKRIETADSLTSTIDTRLKSLENKK